VIAESLTAWTRGAQALALVSTANERGYLAYLTSPRSAAQFAAFAALPGGTAADILAALTELGVTEESDGRTQLSADLSAQLSGVTDFAAKIDEAALSARQVASVTSTGQAPLTADEALVVAKAFALRPTGGPQRAGALVEKLLEATPEMRNAISGGRLLDVGSGVSGFVLSAAAVLPGLRATTLELIPAVAAVAIARAKELGVDDRIDVRVLDARDLDEPSAYDAAFWAQPFFPEPTRAATLAMILRSLRPGGLLLVQQMNVEPTDAGAHAEFTLRRLVAHAHDVPHGRPLADVVAEAEQAGFEPLTITQTDFGPIALVRRPR